jgi:uncharacterized membrane protein YcaP (DUF421 family)
MLVLILRVLITYAVVLRVFRMMGKRQLSELQPFELVVSILIADIAAQPLLDVNIPMLTSFIAIVLLALLQVAISYISLYSRGFRRIISGNPVIIIKDGQIDQQKVHDMLLSTDDINKLLRNNKATDIAAIEYAIVEMNGDLSVITKDGSGIIISLVENGKIIQNHLAWVGITQEALLQKLKQRGFSDLKKIYWAYMFENHLKIIPKAVKKEETPA